MIILIEGPDGTGKTTLSRVLEDKYNFTYIHLGPCADIEKTYKELIQQLREYKKQGIDVVIDRAVYSNYVYSTVYGGELVNALYVYEFLHALVDKVILCLPSDKDKYLKTFEELKTEREELYDDMNKIYDLFDSFGLEDKFDRFEESAEQYVDSLIQSNRK